MFKPKSDFICYQEDGYAVSKLIWELYHNAYRTLRSVYLFDNFEEYVFQLRSNKKEDKQDVYWNAAYYEKLIDYVKISIAFGTYNKSMLFRNIVLVLEINPKFSTQLRRKQAKGTPLYFSGFIIKTVVPAPIQIQLI